MSFHSRNHRTGCKCAVVMACLALSVLWMHSARAMQMRWPEGTLKYLVIDQSLTDVFQHFSSHLNVPISLSKRVSQHKIAGRIPPMGAKDFLEWLCTRHSLVWYFDGTVLHIEPQSEFRRRVIASFGLPETAIMERLAVLDAADSRFTVKSAEDNSRVVVDGPPSFAAQVQRVVAQLVTEPVAAQPAKAEDRIGAREQSRTNPQDSAEQDRIYSFQDRLPQTEDDNAAASAPQRQLKGSRSRMVNTPTGKYWVREEPVVTRDPAQAKIWVERERRGNEPRASETIIQKKLQPKKVRVFRGT